MSQVLTLNDEGEVVAFGVFVSERWSPHAAARFCGAFATEAGAEQFIAIQLDSPDYFIEEIPIRD